MHDYSDTDDEQLGGEDHNSREGLGSKGGDFGSKYVTRLDTLFIVVISPLFCWTPPNTYFTKTFTAQIGRYL